jgi:hypothetical protein
MNPYRPSRISARRPRWSARRAQCGAVSTQIIAERLNATATQMSGTPSWRPIAGISDCIAVLPAAATSITANSKANRSRGREGAAVILAVPEKNRGASARAEMSRYGAPPLPSALRFANATSLSRTLRDAA